jgi:hypothetical protein
MEAELRPDLGFLGMAGETYKLKACNPQVTRCFISPYMSFSAPQSLNVLNWTNSEGVEFSQAGSMKVKVGKKHFSVRLVASRQRTGNFLFYYDETFGLVGWQLATLELGEVYSIEYLATSL